ncbi:MAG TPA: hypothetical protein VFD50_04460 [Thermoleophilia bacterium]|nr:hypothetical protein [Thermoleophilia bacterium]
MRGSASQHHGSEEDGLTSFKVLYLEELGVVETVWSGQVTAADVDRGVTETGILAAENLCTRFLVDLREQTPGGSTLDIFSLAEFLCSLPPGTIEREAVLTPRTPAAADEIKFFETACRNRGLDVRMLDDRSAALEWLTS